MKIEDGKLVLPDGTRLRIHQGNQTPAQGFIPHIERPKNDKPGIIGIPPGRDQIAVNLERKRSEKHAIAIGLDPGVDTGVAVWDHRNLHFTRIESMKIHEAMDLVKEYKRIFAGDIFVRFEDARLRDWFGTSGREKLQGAGSIKRDSKIWEDFLIDNKIDFVPTKPTAGGTKMKSAPFAKLTNWRSKTNEHNRDAALLVWQY